MRIRAARTERIPENCKKLKFVDFLKIVSNLIISKFGMPRYDTVTARHPKIWKIHNTNNSLKFVANLIVKKNI